jgi:hypothetical protein
MPKKTLIWRVYLCSRRSGNNWRTLDVTFRNSAQNDIRFDRRRGTARGFTGLDASSLELAALFLSWIEDGLRATNGENRTFVRNYKLQRPCRKVPSFARSSHVKPKCLVRYSDAITFSSFYFGAFFLSALRRRTPGPPPFSSINSTPAASSATLSAARFAAVTGISPSIVSTRRIVATPTFEALAKSTALHLKRARAARSWALEMLI